MGMIFSRFRKQPTTLEKLKKIEDGLRKIEDYKRTTEQKQKRTVANLLIYGVALYMLACVIVFVWFLPESWLVRLALLVPLVLVPLIIYWMKKLLSKYFDTKMVKANEEYVDLQRKKKDLIDSIMETETFNKATEILSRYAPEKLEKKEPPTSTGTVAIRATGDLRKRNTTSANTSATKLEWITPVNIKPQSTVPNSRIEPVSTQTFTGLGNFPQFKLPQPLFSKDRSFGDKLVEYIVGDGPGYRYALICKFCREHNGMAIQEEFPYMSYTCCYCRKFNPAKITRPTAPRLPEPESLREILDAHSSIPPGSRGARVPKLIPFDKYVDECTRGVQDTDESVDHVTARSRRISNTEPSDTLVEDAEDLSEPEDICINTLEKAEDYLNGTTEDELNFDESGTDTKHEQPIEMLPTSSKKDSQSQEEIFKESPTGSCHSTNK